MTEQWKPVPSLGGMYEASSLGRVRSVSRVTADVLGRERPFPGMVLSPAIDSHTGYLKVSPHIGGRRHYCYVHWMVAEAFLGPRPKGMCVAHGDGNKTNNRVDNLRYATQQENCDDQIGHGTRLRGQASSQAVITDQDAQGIDSLLRDGWKQADIARRFGIARTTVSSIACGRSWGHLTGRVPAKPHQRQLEEVA